MNKLSYSTRPLAAAIIVALSLGFAGTAMAASHTGAGGTKADASPAPQTTTPDATPSTSATKAQDKKRQSASQKQVTELNAVKVTGIAGSQQKDIVLKRYSDQIQDSITAQHIGQLPDVDISDALGRVTGVQINRSAGQGGTVSIRGIAQVKTTLNGEEYFNAGGADQYNRPTIGTGQADFEAVPSSLVKGIDVLKSTTAADVAGGISGIINLNTYRPFDFKNTYTFSGAAEEQQGDRTRKYNPTTNALFAYHNDRWGALISASYSDQTLADRSPNVGNAGIEATEQKAGFDFNGDGVLGNNTDATQIPRDYYYAWNNQGFDNKTSERKRYGLHGSAEFKINDAWLLIGDVDYSEYKTQDQFENLGLQTSNATFAQKGANITPDGVLLQGTTAYGKLNEHSQVDNSQSKAINTNLELRYDAGGFFSGTARWVHSHAFRSLVEGDIDSLPNSDSNIKLRDGTNPPYNPNGIGLGVASVDYTGKYPSYNIISNVNDPANWLAASSWGLGNHIDVGTNIYRADGTFHFNDGIFDSLQIGARYEKVDYVYDGYKYLSPVSPAGSCANPTGPGPQDQWYYFRDGQITDSCTGFSEAKGYQFTALPSNYITRFNNFNPLKVTGTGLQGGFPAISTKAMHNPIAFLNSLSPGETKFLSPSESYLVSESIKSAYAQLNLDGELGFINDTPWRANLGLRAVKTAINIGAYITDASQYIGNNGNYNGVFINQGTKVTTNNYTSYLPAANVTFEVTPDQQLRLAFSDTEARQDLAILGQGFAESFYANGSPPRYPNEPQDLQVFNSASEGNPNLKPFRAKNYNASYAWYFNPQSIVYLGAFLMQVGSFPQSVTVHADLPDNDGVVRAGGPLSTYINGGTSQIRGLEGEFRTQFTHLPGLLSGLGTELNYTYANTGKTGLAHNSYNAIVFYQKGPLQARLAYNWRGTNFNGGNSSLGDPLNIYSKPVGYLDASIYYTINDNVSVYLQGSNLTDAYDDEYAQYPNAFYSQNISERRYTAGVRVKF